MVTFDAPSAVSDGLCLAHAACDKRLWLEGLNVDMDWPMSGKSRLLYLDNPAEFKSEALRRGCEQHGIRLDYRPPGQPHYSGIVERIIGTAMQMIDLPGTTFSNPTQRGEYDADNMAALTLRELERWLTLAVGTYHGTVHNGLLQPPAARWAEAVARIGVPPVVTRPNTFLVDFLPVIRRTLTRAGFVNDHIRYHADALKPWIARRDRLLEPGLPLDGRAEPCTAKASRFKDRCELMPNLHLSRLLFHQAFLGELPFLHSRDFFPQDPQPALQAASTAAQLSL